MELKPPTRRQFHLSLTILVPAIFAGMGVLSAVLAFRIGSAQPGGDGQTWFVFLMVATIGAFAYATGLLIVRALLTPIEKFVKTVEGLPAVTGSLPAAVREPAQDPIGHYSRVFDRVTDILGNVEAGELFPEIAGRSQAIRAVLAQIRKVAPSDSTVLLLGESGTGKELAAQSIHGHSLRKEKPFIRLNCAAIPEGLLESELFGHEKGAFTGASAAKPGKFELAHGGTLLLDEIGDMPPGTQAKILRVLEQKEVERVGGTKPIPVDVRFIASTNKDLSAMVREGRFREDLFYRLNAFTIELPALRERKEDIPILAARFLGAGSNSPRLAPAALDLLTSYAWPGNVRELKHTMERAALVCEGGVIEPRHLPHGMDLGSPAERDVPPVILPISIDERLAEMEKTMILQALRQAGGIQARAAELLGINQRSLWHRIKKYKIDAKQFKTHEV